MRLLFLALLLLNLALFGWHWFAPRFTAPSPPPAAERGSLKLLSEVGVQSEPGCYLLGPLSDPAVADMAVASVKSQGLNPAVEREEQLEPLGYWVYLPPAASLQDAQALGQRLAEKGITDYVFVVGAEKANAISLGLYPEQDRAQARASQLQALGFSPQLEQRFTKRLRIQLSLEIKRGVPPGIPGAPAWRRVDCQASS